MQELLGVAIQVLGSMERFVQLHDPTGKDIQTLELLRMSLKEFGITGD